MLTGMNSYNRNRALIPAGAFRYSLWLAVMALFLAGAPAHAQDDFKAGSADALGYEVTDAMVSGGESVFSANCAQCHAVHEQVVGPALKDVWERRDTEWLVNFIKYPQRVIDGGDEYAVALYEKYQQYMPNHDFLSDDEIKAVLGWVYVETKKGPAKPVVIGPTTEENEALSQGPASTLLTTIIFALMGLLAIVLVVMGLLISVLIGFIQKRDDISDDEKAYLTERFNLWKLVNNPAVAGLATFLFVGIVGQQVILGLFTVGVQQGYAPDQPIKFSHKLHAGYYEIDCKYCHTGVEKSKSANIPSANICMNCHNRIKTTSPEIQKIYKHIENDEPIQRVRVHNLPDLSYINHSQHVKVGGLECEQCHGEIKKMEVVQQHSLLTMGWCINCHRKTEVNGKSNEYYDRMLELHNAATDGEPLHVEEIGGLECGKCHY